MAELGTTSSQSATDSERQNVQTLWRQENAAFRARVLGEVRQVREREGTRR